MSVQELIPKRQSHVTFGKKILKQDTKKLVVNNNLSSEDEFLGQYGEGLLNPATAVIAPPYTLTTLSALVTRNNTLAQCIWAMEVNIDGTGHTFELVDAKAGDDEAEKARLEAFFNEPFPDESFVSIRRKMRYDLESIGNGYLEVMRNVAGNILLLRYIDGLEMRLVRLDDPIPVVQEIDRDGEKMEALYWVRERRYIQKVGTHNIFFKEFGSKRVLNRKTGNWAKDGETLDPKEIASEIIHFTCQKEAKSPYGVPRWINQLPSILGSRKAEEFNLEFFDSGGVPPAVVFVQGGMLTEDVRDQLQAFFSGAAKTKNRIAVVEVQSSSGTLDSAGQVKVSTERFGDFRSQDSMFQNYDANCEEHVRTAFRLPTLFLGKATDLNFATAMTSYMVTEAQVFAPERFEFDEVITKKLLQDMGAKKYRFVSRPVTLRNVDLQLKAMEMSAQKVDGDEYIGKLNEITSLNLKYSKDAEDKANEMAMAPKAGPKGEGTQPGGKANVRNDVEPMRNKEPDRRDTVQKEESPEKILDLVSRWSIAVGLDSGEMSHIEKLEVLSQVDSLSDTHKRIFDNMLAAKSFQLPAEDPEGLAEIAGCCAEHMH
jgi:PBSX family phage portal protein